MASIQFHREIDMKRFKSFIKEDEDETLYTLELEKNQNPQEVLFLMNSLLRLIYKQLKNNNLMIYVDTITNDKINEEISRNNIKSIRSISRDIEKHKDKHQSNKNQ
jgi:hypothetical protein